MLALVAVLLANADGRTGTLLARLFAVRRDARNIAGAALGSFVVNALVAATAGALANRIIGQGIVALLVAFALLTAAAALVWRGRLGPDAASLTDTPPARLWMRLALSQLGDRSHFLIGALAATSGAGAWAAAGGLIGWLLALLPWLAFGPGLAAHPLARIIRMVSAGILMLWGIRTAMTAFGL